MFKDEMVYAAERHTNAQGMRVYSEMHWSDWWWNTQVYFSHTFQHLMHSRTYLC